MVAPDCPEGRAHDLLQTAPRRAGATEARTQLSRLHHVDQKAGLASSRELLATIARRIQVADSAALQRDSSIWRSPVCRTANSTAGIRYRKTAEVRTTTPVDAEHPRSGRVGFVVELTRRNGRRRLRCRGVGTLGAGDGSRINGRAIH